MVNVVSFLGGYKHPFLVCTENWIKKYGMVKDTNKKGTTKQKGENRITNGKSWREAVFIDCMFKVNCKFPHLSALLCIMIGL